MIVKGEVMELIDRYLQAVKFWLPKTQKQDIIAELSEDIRSQVEEKEAELGRKLNDAEVEAILIQRGSPIVVANRYLPQRHLIGPLLFPVYSLVLKMAWLFYLVPWLFVWICIASFAPSYRAQNPGTLITGALHTFWLMAVYTFASVTVAFALVERYHLKSGFLEKWDPRKLPPIYDFKRIKRSSSIAEIVALVVVCTWWIGVMSSPAIVNNAELHITLAPVWQYFFWGFLLLAAANLVLSGVNLFRPYRNRHQHFHFSDSSHQCRFAGCSSRSVRSPAACVSKPEIQFEYDTVLHCRVRLHKQGEALWPGGGGGVRRLQSFSLFYLLQGVLWKNALRILPRLSCDSFVRQRFWTQ